MSKSELSPEVIEDGVAPPIKLFVLRFSFYEREADVNVVRLDFVLELDLGIAARPEGGRID